MTINEFCKLYDLKGDLSFFRCNLTSSKKISRRFGMDERFNVSKSSMCECRAGNSLFNPFEIESITQDSKNSVILHRAEFDIRITGCYDIKLNTDRNAKIGSLGMFSSLTHTNEFSVECYGSDFLLQILKKKDKDLNSLSYVTMKNLYEWNRVEDWERKMNDAMYSLGIKEQSIFHIVESNGLIRYDYFSLFN